MDRFYGGREEVTNDFLHRSMGPHGATYKA